MKELKYRAWDTEKQEMAEVMWIGIEDCEVGLKDSECRTWVAVYPYVAVVMPYTGYKDINGTEIYEGDIVKYTPNNSERLVEMGMKGYDLLEVELGIYGDGEYVDNVVTWKAGYEVLSEITSKGKVEVVGNVWQK